MTSSDQEPDHDVLTLSVRRRGDTAVITMSGELDLHSSDRLADAVADALATEPRAVEVDAGEIHFADSAGLRALLLARANAISHSATLRLTAMSAQLSRLLSMTGLQEILTGGSV